MMRALMFALPPFAQALFTQLSHAPRLGRRRPLVRCCASRCSVPSRHACDPWSGLLKSAPLCLCVLSTSAVEPPFLVRNERNDVHVLKCPSIGVLKQASGAPRLVYTRLRAANASTGSDAS